MRHGTWAGGAASLAAERDLGNLANVLGCLQVTSHIRLECVFIGRVKRAAGEEMVGEQVCSCLSFRKDGMRRAL